MDQSGGARIVGNLEDMCRVHEVKPRGVIHLGAHVGQEIPVYSKWGVPVAWVEANADLIPELEKNVKGLPGHMVYHAAIWSKDDEQLPFFVANNGGSSSLLPMKLHLKRYPEVLVEKAVQVKTLSIDGLVKRAALDPDEFDFLNMDLQGAEGHAISGMVEQAKHLRWIYTEVSFEELYADSWLFEWIYAKFRSLGFGLLECRRAGLGWGEALFGRSDQ